MKPSRYDCNPDVVISMQEHDVRVPDILQYCHALLSEVEIENLIHGLQAMTESLEAGTSEENALSEEEAVEVT